MDKEIGSSIAEPSKIDEHKEKENNNSKDVKNDEEELVNLDRKSPEIELRKGSKSNSQEVDEKNLHYEDGLCIYTDPDTKCQYIWDEKKQEWVIRNESQSEKDYEYDGNTYTYMDKETSTKYIWDEEKKEWKTAEGNDNVKTITEEPKRDDKGGDDTKDNFIKEEKKEPKEITKQDMTKGQYGFENNTHIYTDPADGSKYFWDKERNAWFPKVDDDFLAQYQMSYGFTDPNVNQEETKKPETPPLEVQDKQKRKAPQEPTWFDVGEESTKVYVSGLPSDITESEFVEVMQKCGLVMRDIDSGKMKVKIYLDPESSLPKGDALCTYIKKESVDLALNLLDGSDVRGRRIKVERAKFTMKGKAYDPSLKPKKRRKKDLEKMKKIQEKLLDWRPDKMRGERSKHESIVIVKNLFDPVIFNKDVKLILEYQQDLREECLKCGSVKKVIIYDRHPEGVAQINFREVEAADACVQLLNNRWFGQRKITAETWDGKTKYKMSETDEQIKERLQKWEKFLETGEPLKSEEKINKDIQPENKPKDKTDVCEKEEDGVSCKPDEPNEISERDKESDQDTVSNVGSDYETDEEVKKS